MTINVDLHVHTCYSVDGRLSPEAVVGLCQRRGMGTLAITDHNTIAGALVVRQVAPFPVIVGQEISTADGEMMALFIEDQVPRDLSASETIARVKRQGGLVRVPHPFDRLRGESLRREVLHEVADELDFIEGLNARVTFGKDNDLAREFARGHGLPCTAGSDAHTKPELGRAYVEMEPFEGGAQFLSRLAEARISGSSSPFWVHFFSIYEKARQRLVGD